MIDWVLLIKFEGTCHSPKLSQKLPDTHPEAVFWDHAKRTEWLRVMPVFVKVTDCERESTKLDV